jgi:TRAP-type uncharacterized transport system fused permease subunit
VLFRSLLWGAAAIGHWRADLKAAERILAAAGAFLLVAAIPITDELGFAAAAVFVAWHWLRTRKLQSA